MANLAIVIPWWNNHTGFEDTLASVLQNRPESCEVWVVHNQPYNDPWQLSGEVHFLEADAPNEVGLIECGWRATDSPFIHVLRCGYQVPEGWTEPALQHFQHAHVASVAPVIVPPGERPRVAVGISWSRLATRRVVGMRAPLHQLSRRRFSNILGPSLAAGFYRRAALVSAGGFDVEMGVDAADVDLAITLQRLGYTTAVETDCRVAGPYPPTYAQDVDAAGSIARLYWRYAPRPTWWAHLVRTVQVCYRVSQCRSWCERWAEIRASWRAYSEHRRASGRPPVLTKNQNRKRENGMAPAAAYETSHPCHTTTRRAA